jgi:stage V sporulation protein T
VKATGIVRRIDDLGRIVVPKEIRRTLRIREGDPLEIFTDREGEIILKKYSPIGELGQFAGEYAESLAQTTGYLVLVTDCDHVIAASGSGKKEFEEKIKKAHSNFKIDFSKEDCIKIKEYTEGNRVKTIQIGNIELSGVEVRNLLGLRSANFKVTIEKDNIIFEVTGYGHGVGMSQTGADSLAKQGKNYEEIICHFYSGVKVQDI